MRGLVRSLTTIMVVVGAVFGAWISQTRADALNPEARSLLETQGAQREVSVVVHLADEVDMEKYVDLPRTERRKEFVRALKDRSASTQGEILSALQARGVRNARSLWLINAIAMSAPPEAIRELATDPRVAEIRPDHVIPLYRVTYSTTVKPEWNIDLIGAKELWDKGHSGRGIVVASLDSGVDITHPDLKEKWRGGAHSWLDPYGEHKRPHDAQGHGTMTMGVMVGGRKGGTAIGVAPDARWIAVKIFDDSGNATDSAIHEGFQWVLDPDGDPDTDDAPDIVNNSWGSGAPECSQVFEKDIRALKAAGIAVVFAAGNEGPGVSTSDDPASNPKAFSVGSIGEKGKVSSFSSRGPSLCNGTIFPTVTAPGAGIRTCRPYTGRLADSYSVVDGTSFSAPHAAGAMALLLSAFPGLPVAQLEQVLKQSATDLGPAGPDNSYGRGLINVDKALRVLESKTVTRTCTSSAGGSGWVMESAQGSEKGGEVRTSPDRLRVGDNQKNGQVKAILSFHTAGIPSKAIITSATLVLKAQDKAGTPLFPALGSCAVDVLADHSTAPGLHSSDFQALPKCRNAALLPNPFSNRGISRGFFKEAGLKTISKTGYTRLRVYFSHPTNGNGIADAVVFHGDGADSSDCPKLKISYIVP